MKFLTLFIILFSIGFVSASVTIGKPGNEVTAIPGEKLTGWINISLNDEPAENYLRLNNTNILLIDFLRLNSALYSCIPFNCEKDYYIIEEDTISKNFQLKYNENKIIGIRLTGNVTGIDSLSFNVNSNAGESCIFPLEIDVLNDGIEEFAFNEPSADYNCIIQNPYGCFNRNDVQDSFLITDTKYCNTIRLNSNSRNYKIGAEVKKKTQDNVTFYLDITVEGNKASCNGYEEGGTISCNLSLEQPIHESTDAEVCISVASGDNGKYEIEYENNNPCGHAGSEAADFPIFTYPGKFKGISNFTFNQDKVNKKGIILSAEIWNYISSKYRGNCNPECWIPIRFYAGIDQTLDISGVSLVYKKGGTTSNDRIGFLKEKPAYINSNFQTLDLSFGNLTVPLKTNFLSLFLGEKLIFQKSLNSSGFVSIKDVFPKKIPAQVNMNFKVIINENVTDVLYKWDFGDGTPEITTEIPYATHKYTEIKNYNLKVKVVGNQETYRIFTIEAVSPKNYINQTIIDYNVYLNAFESQLLILPENLKIQLRNKLKTDTIKNKLVEISKEYTDAFTDDEYIGLMADLSELKIPINLTISQKINPSPFIPNQYQINLENLQIAGAGNTEDLILADYFSANNGWLLSNLDSIIESDTYSVIFADKSIQDAYSLLKISISPKTKINKLFIIINQNPSELFFISGTPKQSTADFTSLIFENLNNSEHIQFYYPGKISIATMPFFISPLLSELEGMDNITCNRNNKCEKNLGENYKNCRVDCKPIAWTIFLIFILFFIGFVVYIILQEWYKRYYEKNLFPNKNQLFNIINFIYNSNNQGFSKNDLFNKLKESSWTGEQINYAWKKLHGKRTGMWEIPVFKWLENKKVREELARRR